MKAYYALASFLLVALPVAAVQITSGTINGTNSSLGMILTSTMVGNGLQIAFDSPQGIGTSTCFGTTCLFPVNRTSSGNFGFARVTFGGIEYVITSGLTVASNAADRLSLSLDFTGPSVLLTPVVDGSGVANLAYTSVNFAMTGTATLVVGGVTIFSNLALDGSGNSMYGGSNPPVNQQWNYQQTFEFQPASQVPEPSTVFTALAGIGLIGWQRLRARCNRVD